MEKLKKAVVVRERLPAEATSAEVLIAQAIQKGLTPEALDKFLTMRRELKQEWAREEYFKAMAQFQAECPVIQKTTIAKDEYGKIMYKYADLDATQKQTQTLISKNGFSYMFRQREHDNTVEVDCVVSHEAGHSEVTSMDSEFANKTRMMSMPQQKAATVTFLKRYAFWNAFGIMTGAEDTDGAESAPPAIGKPDSITDGQIATIKNLAEQLGGTLEQLEGQVIKIQKKSISDLTLEGGKKLIDTLRKRVELKKTESKPVTDEELADVEEIMDKPIGPANDNKTKRQCPFCGEWHDGNFPKCMGCWKKEQAGQKLVLKPKTKVISNPNEPPFPNRPGEVIH